MSNNILSVIKNRNLATSDIMKVVASNVKAMRLGRNISQKEFASKVGIALPTYRRFETTGEISFRKLVEISKFFDLSSELEKLFTKKEYTSIEEVTSKKLNRKRASKNG